MGMRGWKTAVPLALVMLATFWLMAGLVRHSQRIATLRDAATLSLFLFEDRTTYAAGFSEAAFKTVRPGTRERELKHVLGDPLRVESRANGRLLIYSMGPADASYWVRAVQVDSSETVVRIFRAYFAD